MSARSANPPTAIPGLIMCLSIGDTIRFRRVEYPWEQTIQKIYAIPQLDNFLSDRLREGRGTAFLSPALKTLSCRVK